jgi:opacity protein-like surface antigen
MMKFILASIVSLFLVGSAARAGDQVSIPDAKTTIDESTPFDKGQHEFQLSAGAYTSLFNFGPYRPKITDIDTSLRLGWMLYTPRGSGFFRGNFEFLIEADGALDVQGPKTGAVGGNLVFRYNFVQPGSKWAPYVQLQGGGVYNDIAHDPYQHLIGRDEEFFLGVGVGVRYFLNPRTALTVEIDYRHNSDANTANRNIGLNSVGGMLGVSVFF